MLSESPDPALLICLDFNVDIGVVSAFFCADIRLICGLLTDAADCFRLQNFDVQEEEASLFAISDEEASFLVDLLFFEVVMLLLTIGYLTGAAKVYSYSSYNDDDSSRSTSFLTAS